MPAVPKFCGVPAYKRIDKIFRYTESENSGKTDRHVAVSRKVEINFKRKKQAAAQRAKTVGVPVSPIRLSTTAAQLFAIIAFFPSPTEKRKNPESIFRGLGFILSSCGSISSYRTIGPAMSWGKNDMYKRSLNNDFWLGHVPR